MSDTTKAILVVVGFFVLLGMMFAGTGSSSPSTGTTRTTLSSWCQQHAEDEWSGRVDSITRRYFAECA